MQTGRKSSQFRYHAEAICTGSLAGHNAVRLMIGMPLLILPASIAIGDLIGYANEKSATREGRMNRYTFAGAGYLKRMEELGLYTTDINEINTRMKKLNLDNIFEEKLV